MSIAILNQVYDEARRLAIAGSVVAKGDFRLKKLVAPLEQAGTKAPVFAKVAEAASKVIDGPEDSSAERLLELTSLVTAVLYTQGETGLPGELQPIETINLGGETAQTSARLLKPLLEALTSTGSGRLELVKEGHERGAFRDIRLVQRAIKGLDDPYSEIADYLEEKVLPMYGKAILVELQRTYDPKGTKGHPRRLRLMHALDPTGTRELVKQALEEGSKDVKVAAIACLGSEPEDLSFLIEQTGAKAQDVRAAAYRALATINDPAAVAALDKAFAGKDLDIAVRAVEKSKTGNLTERLVAEITKGAVELPKLKDKKKVSDAAERLSRLISILPAGEHADADRLTLDLFNRRAELAKAKGTTFSGSDVVEAVIARMADGPPVLQHALARSHAELKLDHLQLAARAARRSMKPEDVYVQFSTYLTAKVNEKKKDQAWLQREYVIEGLGVGARAWYYRDRDAGPLDPRWLDLAVRIGHLPMIQGFGPAGHAGAEAFLSAEYDLSANDRNQDYLRDVINAMIETRHPRAAEALVATYAKTIGRSHPWVSWYRHRVPSLPKSALAVVESVIPRLKGDDLNYWVDAVEQLRNKKE